MTLNNKYSDFPPPTDPVTDEPLPEPTVAASASPAPQAQLQQPGVINHAPYPVESSEHTRPLIATISYVTDMVSDSLVRIYDQEIAPRDEAFCVAREELQGRTPEQLRDHFALAFVPRFVCDAHVPVGNTITVCSLVNAERETVKVFYPRTRLELANERPLGSSLADEDTSR